jgi:hypothetical protein
MVNLLVGVMTRSVNQARSADRIRVGSSAAARRLLATSSLLMHTPDDRCHAFARCGGAP